MGQNMDNRYMIIEIVSNLNFGLNVKKNYLKKHIFNIYFNYFIHINQSFQKLILKVFKYRYII